MSDFKVGDIVEHITCPNENCAELGSVGVIYRKDNNGQGVGIKWIYSKSGSDQGYITGEDVEKGVLKMRGSSEP